MEDILTLVKAYADWIQMGFIFLNTMVLLALLHKMNIIRKKLNQVTGQVEDYLHVVLESEEQKEKTQEENRRKQEKEAQTKLISSVLDEVFS